MLLTSSKTFTLFCRMTQFQSHRAVFWPNGLFIVDVLSRRSVTASATRMDGMSDEFQKWYCVFLRRTVAFSRRGDSRIRRRGIPAIGVTLIEPARFSHSCAHSHVLSFIFPCRSSTYLSAFSHIPFLYRVP